MKRRHGDADGAKLAPGKLVRSVDSTEKITVCKSNETEESCCVRGLCPLPDGEWLVIDVAKQELKRFDHNGRITARFPLYRQPYDVCYIEEKNVVAVTTEDCKIELISIAVDSMTRIRTIPTENSCCSVTYAHEKLYVTSWYTAEIYVLDYSEGVLERTISPRDSQGEKIFSHTQYITSSEDGSRLFMNDRRSGLFIIDTGTDDVIHNTRFVFPVGVCLAEDDGLFVATDYDGIIHLDRNGTKLSTVVTREMMEGLTPWGVSYDKRTTRLAITVVEKKGYMFVFHVK